MKDMTALDNPNSVQQMKQWLKGNGLETDSLGKKVVAELIKTAPPELADCSGTPPAACQVLRQEISDDGTGSL
jgi:hypothetical protein